MNEETFRKGLATLTLQAKGTGWKLNADDVKAAFEGLELKEAQWDLVYGFLNEQGITVLGKPTGKAAGQTTKALTGEDSKFYKMYLEDVAAVTPMSPEELKSLFDKGISEDSVRERITEGYLKRVIEIAREYTGLGVLIADLVGEGNMALVTSLDAAFEAGYEEFESELEGYIRSACEACIEEQTGQTGIAQRLADRSNKLLDMTEKITEELGREPTKAELARRMELSEDDIADIMRQSLDAINMLELSDQSEADE